MSITDDIDVLTTAHHPSDWTDLDTRAVDTAIASGDAPIIGYILVGCADLSLREGDARLAATLLGAAEAMNGAIDHSIWDRVRVDAEARAVLGEESFTAAYRRGLMTATIPSLAKLTGLPLAALEA